MQDGYSKLWSKIITSSIWVADDDTFRVFIAMLALKNSEGIVSGAVPGMANVCRMSTERFLKAETNLTSPDPFSTTPDEEGRRILKIPGGWRVVNHQLYRDKGQSSEGSRAPYMRQWREKKNREAMQFAEIPTIEEVVAYGATIACSDTLCREFHTYYERRDWSPCIKNGNAGLWRVKLVEWRERQRLPGSARRHTGNTVTDRISLEKQLKIIQDRIDTSIANPESAYHNPEKCTIADKALLKTLRDTKRGIENKLIGMPQV